MARQRDTGGTDDDEGIVVFGDIIVLPREPRKV